MSGCLLSLLIILVLFLICSICDKSSYFSTGSTVYLFHSSKCGHCINLKDASRGGKWPMFLIRAKNAGIRVHEVQVDTELSRNDKALIARVGPMPGVPYIVKIDASGVHPFTGKRTDEELMRWALV